MGNRACRTDVVVRVVVVWLWGRYSLKHCGAHRQNLAIKACFYSIRAIKFFFEVVELLGRFFDFSNKRTAEYEEVQAELDEPQAKSYEFGS